MSKTKGIFVPLFRKMKMKYLSSLKSYKTKKYSVFESSPEHFNSFSKLGCDVCNLILRYISDGDGLTTIRFCSVEKFIWEHWKNGKLRIVNMYPPMCDLSNKTLSAISSSTHLMEKVEEAQIILLKIPKYWSLTSKQLNTRLHFVTSNVSDVAYFLGKHKGLKNVVILPTFFVPNNFLKKQALDLIKHTTLFPILQKYDGHIQNGEGLYIDNVVILSSFQKGKYQQLLESNYESFSVLLYSHNQLNTKNGNVTQFELILNLISLVVDKFGVDSIVWDISEFNMTCGMAFLSYCRQYWSYRQNIKHITFINNSVLATQWRNVNGVGVNK
jgi:hypothetical protein